MFLNKTLSALGSFIVYCFLAGLGQVAFAQQPQANSHSFSCGQMEPSREQHKMLEEKVFLKAQQRSSNGRTEANPLTYIPIRIHIIRKTDGTGGVSELEVFKGIAAMNVAYRIINMQFYVCGAVNYIDNTTYYDFSSTDEAALATAAGEGTGVINIYYANTVTSSGTAVGGYAYLPGGPERMLIKNSQCNDDKTVPHEMGHYFGLYHTFRNSDNATVTERELITRGAGANCTTKGDLICDTPSDPYNRVDCGTMLSGCTYIGTCTDANGDTFAPQVGNVMGYNFGCGNLFTAGQYSVMATSWETPGVKRDYTSTGRPSATGCSSPTLVANPVLSATTTCNSAGLTINWTDIAGEIGYFIERSSDGGATFNSIGSVLANVTTFTDATAASSTNYQYRVKPINSNANFSNTISVTTCLIYCTPTYTQPCYVNTGATMAINSFSTTTATTNISNLNSGCSTNAYGDFTSITGVVAAGTTINYSLNFNIGGCFPQTHAIWIDFNSNGTFEGTSVGAGSEMVAQSITTGCTINGSLSIPAGTSAGTYRMRVRSRGGAATAVTSPCDVFTFGETEDYSLTVTNTNPTITTTGTLSAFSACTGTASTTQTYSVSGSNLTANIVVTAPTGFEISSTGAAPFFTTLNLTPTAGTVGATTITVRQTSGATNGASGNITHTSTGATQKDVAIPTSAVNALPTITLGTINNVSTSATSFTIPYTATTGSPNQYSITTGGATPMPSFVAVTNQALPASPITVTIPASAANTYNFTLTVRNTTTGCVSANIPFTLTVTAAATPTITTTGTLSAFTSCAGSVSAEQSYSVGGTDLTANIVVTAPTGFEVSTTSGGTFSGTLNLTPTSGTVNSTTIYVRQTSGASNGANGNITHTSTSATQKDVAIPTSAVNALPTITLGTINSVNTSATSFTIPYTATTGSPNQYSITTGGATPMPSFVAVTNQALPASPITVTIPASAANTYNFTLTVRNTTTGCVSANIPFTLTVTAIPSTTIYVRTDGNDANNGLSNTAAGAKLTLQGAFTAVGDGNTVVLNAGTYTEAAGLTGKSVTLQGVGNPTVQTIVVNGAGKTLTLSGNVNISQMLDLQAGDLAAGGNLTLLATPTQQAMLIQGAGTTITGNVNVQRYLRANSGTTGLGYRFLSSPVTSATFNEISELSPVVNAAFNTSATPGRVTPFPTVYSYDATKAGDPAKTFTTSPFPEFDKGWVSPTSLSDAMLVGRGYTVNTSANQVVSITGTLNNGNIAVPIVTGNAASLGYNLVGNPYPSPIRWSAVRALSTGVNDAIYQNMATGQYTGSWASFVGGIGTNGATDSIAIMQGFFVVANAAGNINFNNTVRATNYSNPNSFRTENGVNHKGLVRLAMTNSANKTDETVVYFRDEATETFDSQYDAYKFQLNGGNFSNIYTTDNKAEKATLYAINALPTLTDDLVVPVTLQAWTDGEQRIALTEKVNFSREVKVFLKDKTTNTLHDFAKGAYVANLSKGVTAGRYELVFKPQFTAEELSNGVLAIYPNPSKEKSTLTLTDDFKGEVTLRLIDVAGREVWKNTLQKQTTVLQTTVDLSTLPTGLYMVEILGKNKLVQKIVKE